MSSKRPVVLMAILLALLGAYVVKPQVEQWYFSKAFAHQPADTGAASDQAPLPGANTASNLVVTREADGRWMASFDYFYTGAPRGAMVRVFQVVTGGGTATPIQWQVGGTSARRGANRFRTEVFNPNVHEMHLTTQVYALMDVAPAPPMAKVAVEQRIQWPDPVVVQVEQALAAGKPEAIVQKAVEFIDTDDGHKLQKARILLQTLVDKSPRTDAAYVELARVAMKTNWGPTGLREAETLIGSALQISPESVNAKILLGYVYAHQGRYKEAEPLFVQAAAGNPPNLWLWANWGELLAMQGKTAPAIDKYREAIAHPPTKDTYDRARHDAYWRLLRLLEARQDLDSMEGLHKQRAQEYPAMGCIAVDYARFLVLQRADAVRSAAVLRESPSPACDASRAREVQGLTHYLSWSQAKEPDRAEILRQARAFLPVDANLFYALASSDRALPVAQQLVAAGEKVGVQDRRQMDALAYALRNGDKAVARRLLRLGAQPTAEVGPERMPAALIPVLTRDLDAIRLMQRAGVDYTRLRFQGSTAIDHARGQGDTKLLQVLDPKGGSTQGA